MLGREKSIRKYGVGLVLYIFVKIKSRNEIKESRLSH